VCVWDGKPLQPSAARAARLALQASPSKAVQARLCRLGGSAPRVRSACESFVAQYGLARVTDMTINELGTVCSHWAGRPLQGSAASRCVKRALAVFFFGLLCWGLCYWLACQCVEDKYRPAGLVFFFFFFPRLHCVFTNPMPELLLFCIVLYCFVLLLLLFCLLLFWLVLIRSTDDASVAAAPAGDVLVGGMATELEALELLSRHAATAEDQVDDEADDNDDEDEEEHVKVTRFEWHLGGFFFFFFFPTCLFNFCHPYQFLAHLALLVKKTKKKLIILNI
jgi:hypothetical protein